MKNCIYLDLPLFLMFVSVLSSTSDSQICGVFCADKVFHSWKLVRIFSFLLNISWKFLVKIQAPNRVDYGKNTGSPNRVDYGKDTGS